MAKKIILILVIILIILVLITSFISNLLKNKKPETEIKNVIPTAIVNYNSSQNQNKLNPTEKARQLNPTEKAKQLVVNKIISQIKIFPKADLETLSKLNKILPFKSNDFDVEYSPFLNQYFVSKKTPDADKKIALWATDNGLLKLIKNENLFIFTDQPVTEYREKIETIVVDSQYKAELAQHSISVTPTIGTVTPTPNLSITPEENPNISLLIDVLNAFFSIGTNMSSLETEISPSPSNQLNPQVSVSPSSQNIIPLSNYSTAPTSLTEIFNEAGQKVGVPPKILESVMRIECPPTFDLSPQEVFAYSQPGGQLPFCTNNLCSAAGAMQMTIGIDDQGDTTCPRCGAGFCPNQWSLYSESSKNYGGYSHQPNPLNIRDNVYSAAAKLKNDSGANDPNNWTKDQIYSAGEAYYGSCGDNYRYERLGNRTYCEFMWDYYMTK